MPGKMQTYTKLLACLAAIGFMSAGHADDLPLGQGDPSYDAPTGILTLPVMTSGNTNFFNVKIKLDKFTVVEPGLSNQCPVDGVRTGYPVDYTCVDDYATSLALLQGTWRGSNLSKGQVEVTFKGSTISGKLSKFGKALASSDGAGNVVITAKPFSNCAFTGPEADGVPLNYTFRYKVTELNCAEGKLAIEDSLAAFPTLAERFASTILTVAGGHNKISSVSIFFIFDANSEETLVLRKQ